MVETNLRIIEELKTFLYIACKENEIKELFASGPSDFSRDRNLALSHVVGLVANIPKRSLSIGLHELF
ncbi:hypothetical protein [Mariniflexile sp.]